MYLLFVMEGYYPSGGMDDYEGTYFSLEAAEKDLKDMDGDWAHIIDISSGWSNRERHNYRRSGHYSTDDRQWEKTVG